MLDARTGGPKRPVSITLIAWLCLLTSIVTATVLTVWLVAPSALQAVISLEVSASPPASKVAIALFYSVVWVVCGVGLLEGAKWSRPLTLAISLLSFLLTAGISIADLMVEAVWLLLLIWLLFRTKADRWFKSRSNERPAGAT